MRTDMTVDEREQVLVSLEQEILATLGERTEPISLPELVEKVAQANGCATEDVSMALARLSTSVEQVPDGPTIKVRQRVKQL